MPRKIHTAMRDEMVLWVASGGTVKAFSDKHSIPLRTCYSWSASDDFKAEVRENRRRVTDSVVGFLTTAATKAVATLVKLMEPSTGEQTRLGAAKAILAEMVSVASYAELEGEIEAIKKRLDQQQRRAG